MRYRTYIIPAGSLVIREFNGIMSTYFVEHECDFEHDYYYHGEDTDFMIFKWDATPSDNSFFGTRPCIWYVPRENVR